MATRRRPDLEPVVQALFVTGIVSLSLGGIGGNLQPSRIILLLALAMILLGARRVVFLRRAMFMYASFGTILLMGVLTLPLSLDPAGGVSLLLTVALGMSAVLLVRGGRTQRAAAKVRAAWVWGLVATLPLALFEIFSGQHFSFALDQRNAGGEIGVLPFASVFFGNYNNYSTFICLSYPMLLGALMDEKARGRRSLLLVAAAVALAITLINTSRIAILFLSVATILAVFSGYRGSKVWLVVVLAAAIAAVPATGFNLQYAQLRLAADLLTEESASERIGLLWAGIVALRDSFGFGLGPGGFVPFVEARFPNLIPNPHNILIEIAVNFSALSALLFAAVLTGLFLRTWRNAVISPGLSFPLRVTLPFVPLIGALNSLAVGYTYWWYWLASALFIATSHGEATTEEDATA